MISKKQSRKYKKELVLIYEIILSLMEKTKRFEKSWRKVLKKKCNSRRL